MLSKTALWKMVLVLPILGLGMCPKRARKSNSKDSKCPLGKRGRREKLHAQGRVEEEERKMSQRSRNDRNAAF